jgi:hypothetical protein
MDVSLVSHSYCGDYTSFFLAYRDISLGTIRKTALLIAGIST